MRIPYLLTKLLITLVTNKVKVAIAIYKLNKVINIHNKG